MYQGRLEEIEPIIRYAAYNMDQGQVGEVTEDAVSSEILSRFKDLLREVSADQQARTTKVTWLGQQLEISDSELSLAYEQVTKAQSKQLTTLEHMNTLIESFDAICNLVDRKLADSESAYARVGSRLLETKIQNLKHLSAFCGVRRIAAVVHRDWLLLQTMMARFNQECDAKNAVPVTDKSLEGGKHDKKVKAADLAHLLDTCAHQFVRMKSFGVPDPSFEPFVNRIIEFFRALKFALLAAQAETDGLPPKSTLAFTEQARQCLESARKSVDVFSELSALASLIDIDKSVQQWNAYLVKRSCFTGASSVLQQSTGSSSGSNKLFLQPIAVAAKPVVFDLAFGQMLDDVPYEALEKLASGSAGTGLVSNLLGSFWGRK